MQTQQKNLFQAALIRAITVVIVLLSGAESSNATMAVQSFSAENHERFYSGVDKAFIGAPYNSTGVGRGVTDRWATMISDTYFVSATHFRPANGASIRFFHSNDASGAFEDRTVASGQQIGGTDLWLGRLSTAPSGSVARYPVLSFSNNSEYDNIEIYTYGLDTGTSPTSQRLGRNNFDAGSIQTATVDASTGEVFLFDFDNPGGVGADESYLQTGDSGGPSFGIYNGQFALLGIHWFNYTIAPAEIGSGDTLVPNYLTELNAAMLGGESVVVVPEASPLLIMMAGLVIAIVYSSRRRHRMDIELIRAID